MDEGTETQLKFWKEKGDEFYLDKGTGSRHQALPGIDGCGLSRRCVIRLAYDGTCKVGLLKESFRDLQVHAAAASCLCGGELCVSWFCRRWWRRWGDGVGEEDTAALCQMLTLASVCQPEVWINGRRRDHGASCRVGSAGWALRPAGVPLAAR